MSWLNAPVVALDTETTGIDVEVDRIVTCCVGRSDAPGHWQAHNWIINPGVPIPAEATAVHGITDEMAEWAADAPGSLREIFNMLGDTAHDRVPVVGYNLAYDLTLLDREFRRHLDRPLPDGLIVIDVMVLFRRFDLTTGSRRLEDVAKRNGITFPAHDAEADALASLRLLHVLAAQNDLLPLVDPKALHVKQSEWYAAQQSAAHFKRLGNGQHSDEPNLHWPLIPHTTRQDTAA